MKVLGLDVGGANLKAARLGGQGEISVLERPFALFREPHRLKEVLEETGSELGSAPRLAVTMTAELADCFRTKREGVGFVLDAVEGAFPGREVWVYGVDGRFQTIAEARTRPDLVAAANWMASATLVAASTPDALFLDVGSTTTDITPIVSGRVAAKAFDDPRRLQAGELVYTGALRTPVCAAVRSVPLRGRPCRVAAEHFALLADVHLWLGRILEGDYTCETPDGRGRTRNEAGARLARVVCADLEMLDEADLTRIAEHVARAQVRQIASGIRQVLRETPGPRVAIAAGRGAFIAREAARSVGLPVEDMDSRTSAAAPAAAVARLLAEALGS